MTLTIHDTTMTSDKTAHTARHAPSRNGWEVSWLPGQVLDRNTAIAAMILADTAAETGLHEDHRLWPHIQGWAAELGLTGPRGSSGRIPAALTPCSARSRRFVMKVMLPGSTGSPATAGSCTACRSQSATRRSPTWPPRAAGPRRPDLVEPV